MNKELLLKSITGIFRKIVSPVDKIAVAALLDLAEERHYKKGQLILNTDDPCHYVGYVVKGVVRSYYLDNDGNDVTKKFQFDNCIVIEKHGWV